VYEQLRLQPGERLLWTGRPARYPFFDATDLVLVPFSLLWCGFTVFWEYGVLHSGGPTFFVLVGAAFILYGLHLVVGRLVVRALRLRSTRYTLTDRRLIESADRPRTRTTETYLRHRPPPGERTRPSEPIGSVAFGTFPGVSDAMAEAGGGKPRGLAPRRPVLREIEHPEQVRNLITTAQANLGK
jgi:hypothetical protein